VTITILKSKHLKVNFFFFFKKKKVHVALILKEIRKSIKVVDLASIKMACMWSFIDLATD
jgi:hypothetical protein